MNNNNSRPSLKGTKSNFALAINYNTITDDRVKNHLRTEHNVRLWIEDVLQIKLKGGDLRQSLKNGIVLCYLANTLQSDLVPKIQENTSVEFKLQENIIFFLAAMEEMSLPKHKRFQLNDLWEGENMVRVVECLAALALAAQSKGFKPTMLPIDSKTPIVMPSGEELRTLKSLLAQIKEPVQQVKGGRKGAVVLKTQMALLAGNQIDFAKCERGFIAFQTLWRGFKARKYYHKLKRDCAYRDKITQEIYKTEIDYVSNLNICITVYMNTLSELVSKDQLKSIFSDLAIIHAFGNKLVEKLKPRIEKWHSFQKLGDIFIEIADFLKVYTSYIQNYNNALQTLDEVKKKEKVAQALDQCRNNPLAKNFDISAFLIMPIQRVPRYNLLLMDLVKRTWPEHPDYTSLCTATDRMKSIANFLNEKKREGENFQKFTEIQSNLSGKNLPQLFAPTRKYIKQQIFVNAKKDEIVIYLFNDIVVYGRPIKNLIGSNTKNHKVKYHGMIELTQTNVVESSSTANPLQFSLKSPEHSLSLIAKSEVERDEWVGEIKRLIKELIDLEIQTKENKSNPNHLSPNKQQQLKNQEESPTAEQQLLERSRLKSKSLSTSTGSSGSTGSSSNNSGTTNSTSLSTSISSSSSSSSNNSNNGSGPSSPQQSDSSQSPSTISHNHTTSKDKSFLNSFFSKFGGTKSNESNQTSQDNNGQSPSQSSPSSTPSSPTHHNNNSNVESESETDTDSNNTTSPNSKQRPTRPKKSTRKTSVDDIDVGTKKSGSSSEDGGRSRAPSRLQRLTGTLTFRKKKDKQALKDAEDDDTTNLESIDKSDIESITSDDNSDKPQITIDIVSSPSLVSNNNQQVNRNSSDSITPISNTPPLLPVQHTHQQQRSLLQHHPNSNLSTSSNTSSDNDNTLLIVNQNASHSSSTSSFTIEEIKQNKNGQFDPLKLETYLATDDFIKLFGMDQEAFNKLPKWKRDQKKREKYLL